MSDEKHSEELWNKIRGMKPEDFAQIIAQKEGLSKAQHQNLARGHQSRVEHARANFYTLIFKSLPFVLLGLFLFLIAYLGIVWKMEGYCHFKEELKFFASFVLNTLFGALFVFTVQKF